MVKNVLVCFDRDGTLIDDNKHYHLGHQNDWKSKVKIMKGVISGLKKLKKNFPKSKIYFITNQGGVAIKEFPLLDEEKAHEVCKYILKKFEKKGIKFDGYFVCGHPPKSYVKKKKGRYTFNKKMVGNFSCWKPKPGMVNFALKDSNFKKENTNIYVLGDRENDVKTGLNINGHGILIPLPHNDEELKRVKKIKNKKVFIAKNFSDAVEFILRNEK